MTDTNQTVKNQVTGTKGSVMKIKSKMHTGFLGGTVSRLSCRRFVHLVAGFAMMVTFGATLSARAEIIVKTGEKVAFLGDSITAQGWTNVHGYVKLVVAGLEINGVKIVPVPAGVGGNKSSDMLARLKRDVLDKKPDWVTVSCGMNDVIHGAKGIPLDQYKTNMTALVEQCQAAGIKVIMLTTTTAYGKTSEQTKKLGEYSAFLRELAGGKKCPVVDLYPIFSSDDSDSLHALTYDGVHMSQEGNVLLAKTMLKGFGLSEEQIRKAYEAWLDLPGLGDMQTRADVVLNKKFFSVKVSMTLREREKMLAAIKEAKRPTTTHWSRELLLSLMKKKVKPAGTYASLEALFEPEVKDKVQAELQAEFEAEIRRVVTAGRQ